MFLCKITKTIINYQIRKNKYPHAPVSLLADAGNGHFDHSDMLVEYLALFIKKASLYRLPPKISLNTPPKLKAVDPTKGWLVDRWHKDSLPNAPASSYEKYRGDRATAFWYFDKEMASKTEEYYVKARGKKEQYISFVHGGKLVSFDSQLNAHRLKNVRLEDDGLTFILSAVFTDSLREKSSIEYSIAGDINISRICGPVEKVNDTTFAIRFYRMGFDNPKRTGSIWLMAHHDGDNTHKNSVQQVSIDFPYPYTGGRTQKITFDALDNVAKGIKSIKLNATSDSGLPVYYYVKQGPVGIDDNELTFHPIPPRAKYPVKVTVVAWQYGRNSGEKISTAQPIEQTFYITK